MLLIGLALAIGTFGFPTPPRGEIDWNAWVAQREVDHLLIQLEILERNIKAGIPLPSPPADDPPIRIKIGELERKIERLLVERAELQSRIREERRR